MDKSNVKTLFCQTYDIGENEVDVLDFSDKTFSVEIQGQKFHYTYALEGKMIRFKPV